MILCHGNRLLRNYPRVSLKMQESSSLGCQHWVIRRESEASGHCGHKRQDFCRGQFISGGALLTGKGPGSRVSSLGP